MPDRSDVVYGYDGSFEGLLCCLFQSYTDKVIPLDVIPPEQDQLVLLPVLEIPTDSIKARRVLKAIPEKMGEEAFQFIREAFLTCLPSKELYMLQFLRMGFEIGPSVMNMLTDEVVDTLYKAVRHLNGEAHLLKGFIRFTETGGALVSRIGPKNMVLPLIARHFCERYAQERLLIHDQTHGMALVYRSNEAIIVPIEALELPAPDEKERVYRELWRLFYQTIEVEGRHNPRCRRSHMPQRYWSYMTEFCSDLPPEPLMETNALTLTP